MTRHSTILETSSKAAPPLQPLEMPVQDLRRSPRARSRPARSVTHIARFIAFGGAAFLTALGAYQMTLVVTVSQINELQFSLVGLFVVTFAWIAFSASSAVAGLWISRRSKSETLVKLEKAREFDFSAGAGKTALVMPVYNEDPAATTAALNAMADGLIACGKADRFEVFILSDTRDPDVWIKETAAYDFLRERVGDALPVWYRRRWENTARKAGNIKDFVERWGGRYEYMVVLDADSILVPETLCEMTARMDADPRLGILQTLPTLAGGNSLFARLQQFAGALYGPTIAKGVSAWQGEDGNYWGHNAIIRVKAFAASCGLPDLKGAPPLGGAILSHDFVEAALMRRAGWSVRMDTDLGGSLEDSPPSLLDMAARDRRWAQGNLQHLKVIGAAGLAWPSRVHLGVGVGSYLISPIWLLLIIVGVLLSMQAAIFRPEYFTDRFQLFPDWPRFDSTRMRWLFILSLFMLLLPKIIGYVTTLCDEDRRKAFGGAVKLTASFMLELTLSALFAPISMVMQSRQIYEILSGADSGWTAQRRGVGGVPWREATQRHIWHVLFGLTLAVGAYFLAPPLLWWLSPAIAGLLGAIVLSKFSGSSVIGRLLRIFGLLLTPCEKSPPDVVKAFRRLLPVYRNLTASLCLFEFVKRQELIESHFNAVGALPPTSRGAPYAAALTLDQKLRDADTCDEAISWLSRDELTVLVSDRRQFERLLAIMPSKPNTS